MRAHPYRGHNRLAIFFRPSASGFQFGFAMLLAALTVGATASLGGAAQDRDGNPLPPGVLARIGSSRLRHGGSVNEVAYTPDGECLASISNEGFLREKAAAELERFTTGHEDLLRGATKQANSVEVRQHLEHLLTRLDPERLRRTRMLEVLEHVKNVAARQFLSELAAQTEDGTLAQEARESLQRLGQR